MGLEHVGYVHIRRLQSFSCTSSGDVVQLLALRQELQHIVHSSTDSEEKEVNFISELLPAVCSEIYTAKAPVFVLHDRRTHQIHIVVPEQKLKHMHSNYTACTSHHVHMSTSDV